MVLRACKRRTKHSTVIEEREYSTIVRHQCATNEASTSTPFFTLLELPVPLLHDILSRLPLLDILRCRCICRTFLKLLKDPYFSRLHLSRTPILRTNLILQKNIGTRGIYQFFTFDLNEATISSCSSSFDNKIQNDTRPSIRNGLPELCKVNSEFGFCTNGLMLIGSCNGLLCFSSAHPLRPFYIICNPILGERMKLPHLTMPGPLYTYENQSAFFGYCPSTKQYKVVSFIWLIFTDYVQLEYSKECVAYVHTLGSNTWRRVENPTYPISNSLDPFLNGTLHWISDRERPHSGIISSFDLKREKFGFVPPPAHFNLQYVNKLSGLNVCVLRGCLCIFYIYEDVQLDVWVMREYGDGESWNKEFSIDLKFYCRLRVDDLYRPVKLFGNGNLWFISSLNSLVCFSPRKRTFKELRSIEPWEFEVTAHDLSFVSLKDVVGEEFPNLRNFRIRRRDLMFKL